MRQYQQLGHKYVNGNRNMKIRLFIIGFTTSILFFSFFFIQDTYAVRTLQNNDYFLDKVVEKTGVQTEDNIPTLAGNLIKNALSLVGLIFLGLMVYGGFLWMTARGEEEQVSKARKTVTAGIIGIFVIIAAYGITTFVTSRLINGPPPAAGGGGGGGPIVCCIDYVDTSCDDPLGGPTRGTPTWRVTTESDCRTRGSTPTELDCLAGPGTWRIRELPQDIPPEQQAAECERYYKEEVPLIR